MAKEPASAASSLSRERQGLATMTLLSARVMLPGGSELAQSGEEPIRTGTSLPARNLS
jgi:hypothetical protein